MYFEQSVTSAKALQKIVKFAVLKEVALLSLTVIVLQSSSFVFVWLCIVLRYRLLLSLLFDEQIREPHLAATGRPKICEFCNFRICFFARALKQLNKTSLGLLLAKYYKNWKM